MFRMKCSISVAPVVPPTSGKRHPQRLQEGFQGWTATPLSWELLCLWLPGRYVARVQQQQKVRIGSVAEVSRSSSEIPRRVRRRQKLSKETQKRQMRKRWRSLPEKASPRNLAVKNHPQHQPCSFLRVQRQQLTWKAKRSFLLEA